MRLHLRLSKGLLGAGLSIVLVLGSAGCGNSLNCSILGENLKGRIDYSSEVDLEKDSTLVIEWSSESFATIDDSKTLQNIHGLVTVPYSACLELDSDYQVRVFQDTNGNGTLDTGETYGLYDGTSNGTGTATVVNLPSSENNENWQMEDEADITIDATH